MPLLDTDVTLVSRGSTNANASMTQVKDYVLDGLDSSSALVWSAYPTTANNHISSSETKFDEITAIQFRNKSLSIYADNDIVVLTNLATSSAGTYRVTGRNTGTNSITVSFIAYSNDNSMTVGDRMVISNLGPDVDTDQGNQVYINDLQPSGVNGDLWYQPTTGWFYIYDSAWVRIKYDNGPYYRNAVEDWNMDNTGTKDVSGLVQNALDELFKSGARTGTLYFPAGTYRLNKLVNVVDAGTNERGGYVIKGDGQSTKFYCYKERNQDGTETGNVGGIRIQFQSKDNYTTVQDLGIHPKDQIKGVGLYLQNGRDDEAANPEDIDTDDNAGNDPGDPDMNEIANLPVGGSNQQYGVQIINVNILSDEKKPNTVEQKRNATFFTEPLSLINFGRPRLERVIIWNHAERSNPNFGNNGSNRLDNNDNEVLVGGERKPIRYKMYYGMIKEGETINNYPANWPNSTEEDLAIWEYGSEDGNPRVQKFEAPEDIAIQCNITNCYSPWISNCYFNGTAKYGLFWNSSRGNTEGGKVSQCVINGPDIGIYVNQVGLAWEKDDDGKLVKDADGNYIPVMDPDTGEQATKQGRHPHFTVIDSHVNSARRGVVLTNVKYFDISHILFYARNDRLRGDDLIDVHLIDCHSGTLSNSYSGGAVGNSAKSAVPGDEITLYFDFDDADIDVNDAPSNEIWIKDRDIDGDSIALKREARDAQKAKAPYRRHVVIEGVNNFNSKGELVRNRQIKVNDLQLNAYIPRLGPNNRTLFQSRTRNGGDRIEEELTDWYAPYEVIGECADIHISVPFASTVNHPEGTFDSSQYPPERLMITSDTGPVTFTLGGDKQGLIDEGTEGDRFQRMRLELRNSNVKAGDTITSDAYKAMTNGRGIANYVEITTRSDEVGDGRQSGAYRVSTARNGQIRSALELSQNTAYFPVHSEEEIRARQQPVISFNVPGGANNKPGIYYAEVDTNPNNLYPDASPGSLLLTKEDKMYFKKTGSGANGGWREVNLL